MKEEKDLRLTFIKINSNYIGMSICDAKHPYGYEGTEPFRNCIRKYLKAAGFRSISQYLRALPGYSGKINEQVSSPITSLRKTQDFFDISYRKPYGKQALYFSFSYYNKDIKTILSDDLDLITFTNYKMFNSCTGSPMFILMPSLSKTKQFFDPEDYSKLWFCKGWEEK